MLVSNEEEDEVAEDLAYPALTMTVLVCCGWVLSLVLLLIDRTAKVNEESPQKTGPLGYWKFHLLTSLTTRLPQSCGEGDRPNVYPCDRVESVRVRE